MRIHRDLPYEEWRAAVDELPDQIKIGAEKYLSGIVARHKAMKEFAKQCGCRSFDEFESLKKQARQAGAPGARAWVRAGRPPKWRRGE